MILYDGKRWTSYFRREGTVILKASPAALIVAMAAFTLKYLDMQDHIALSKLEIIKNSAAYSGFTFVLGFVLVFRSSQCYNRFWTCAGSACTMRSQLAEAASSLLTFSIMTNKTKEEVDEFAHKIVRLISLLHALCLQHVADKADENFLIIDGWGLGKDKLAIVAQLDQKGRVDMVYQWIGALVMHSAKSGLLATPPPILGRVFQEFEKAMVEYNQVLQLMTIPFPFPYAQVSVLLLLVYMICTPVVMCYYVGTPTVAALLSFISVLCLVSIELIASELENPLGDDANDLPCHEWQAALNDTLLGMLHPHANDVFELTAGAIRDERIFLHSSLQPLDSLMTVEETSASKTDDMTEAPQWAIPRKVGDDLESSPKKIEKHFQENIPSGRFAGAPASQLIFHPPAGDLPSHQVQAFPVQVSPVQAFPDAAQSSGTLHMQPAPLTQQWSQMSSTRERPTREELMQPAQGPAWHHSYAGSAMHQAPGNMLQTPSAVAQCIPGSTDHMQQAALTQQQQWSQMPSTCERTTREEQFQPAQPAWHHSYAGPPMHQAPGIMLQTPSAVAQCIPGATDRQHAASTTARVANLQAPTTDQYIRPPFERDDAPVELVVAPPDQHGSSTIHR